MRKFVLPVFVLFWLLCGGCSGQQTPTEQPLQTNPVNQTAPSEPTIPETVYESSPHAETPVDTPCGVLYIPDNWDLPITTEATLGDPMVLTFCAENVKLYDLTFSESAGECIGMLQTADGPIYVGMRMYELSVDSDMLLSMQESVNYLLGQLKLSKVDSPVQDESVEDPDDELLIDTDIGTLVFPGKWEQYLYTELVDDYALEFYCCLSDREPVLLFTVLLRSEDGDIISSITAEDGIKHALSIWIAVPDFDQSWTEAEIDTVYAMQEDMNYLLSALETSR